MFFQSLIYLFVEVSEEMKLKNKIKKKHYIKPNAFVSSHPGCLVQDPCPVHVTTQKREAHKRKHIFPVPVLRSLSISILIKVQIVT